MELQVGLLVAGYRIVKCLYTSKTGGAVYSSYKLAEREEKDNFASCRVLADKLGWTCVLLPPVLRQKDSRHDAASKLNSSNASLMVGSAEQQIVSVQERDHQVYKRTPCLKETGASRP